MNEIDLYKYCPRCREKLEIEKIENLDVPVCKPCKHKYFLDPKPCITAIVVNDGKILLIKRAIDPGKGLWDLPGGFVQPNETLETALKRELKEELNIKISNPKYFLSKTGKYEFEDSTVDVIVSYFVCEYARDEISLNHEVMEYNFFDLKDTPKLSFLNHDNALEEYRERIMNISE